MGSFTAGCAGQLEQLTGSVANGGRTIGDSASYNGVKVTPDKYVLANQGKRVYPNNRRQMNATSGATYIFTHLTVSHEGDSAQEFPSSRSPDNIDLVYDGERVSEGMRATMTDAYIVSGKQLTTYAHARQNADATGEVYPGKTVDGWLFHKVAKNFDPTKLELQIVWNQQIVGDEGETTHKWTFSEDTKVSIEDVEGDGDGVVVG